MTRILTPRLVLETLTTDEASAITRGERGSRLWAEDYPADSDVVVAAIAIEAGELYDEESAYGVLQVRMADSGLAVGGIGFVHAPDETGAAEVGYGLVGSARHRGLATEALEGVVAWAAAQGLRTMVATTAPDNLASQRVLQRCGFRVVGLEDGGEDGVLQRWERALGAG